MLEPCRICNQKAGIPLRNISNPVGWSQTQREEQAIPSQHDLADQMEVNWWESWNPWVFGNVPQEENRDEPLDRRYTQRAPGKLSPAAAAVSGTQCMQNCDHVWRKTCDIPPEAAQLYNGTPEEYSPDALVQLALKGGNLVKKFGMYPTLCSIQENVLRKMDSQLEYAKQQYEIIPDQ